MAGVKALLKGMKWRPCGFAGAALLARFPWAHLPADFPMDTPWYTGGFEGPTRNAKRMAALMQELHNLNQRYGEEDVVVFVAHGGTIGDLLYRLLLQQERPADFEAARQTALFEGVHNTSVTSLLIPGKHFPFPANMRGNGQLLGFRCALEFMNNTVHLGEAHLKNWAYENIFVVSKL